MSSQTVTLKIPDPLYQQLKERAEQSERSVEDETLDALASAITTGMRLPDELTNSVESLDRLDDDALQRTARSRLAADISEQLEALHLKRQREGLSEDDERTLAGLTFQYERHLLIRAQAVALLKQRGHDVLSVMITKRDGLPQWTR